MLKNIQVTKAILNHPLNKGNKVNAFKRMLNWQLSGRLLKHPVIMPFIEDTKLIVQRGMTGGVGNIYYGLDEMEDMTFLLHFLRKDDYFADIGANIGSYSILAAGCGGARTITFEPIPSTYDRLNANIKVNNLESLVDLKHIGLGSSKGNLSFTTDLDCTNRVAISSDPQDKVITVPVEVLDEVLTECPILMKVDVEGFETEVLNGASKTLANKDLQVIIIELNQSGIKFGYDDKDIIKKLTDLGFSPFEYEPFKRELKPMAKINPTLNTIFIRDLEMVKERVKSSRKYKVLKYEL